jgi:hypothetical protein
LGEPVSHGPLLGLDQPGGFYGGVVTGTPSDPAKQVVRRLLHVLVGKSVCHELARRVWLRLGEGAESRTGQRPGQILVLDGLAP